jgi:ribosomal protein S12 methylthiotransferase accessory factor
VTVRQPPAKPVTLIHDEASAELADLAAKALGHRTPARIAFESPATDGDLGAGQYFLIYDLQMVARAIEWQDRIVSSGGEVIALGQEPGYIWFGPAHGPGSSGCLRCLKLWIANNRRERQHWSARKPPPAQALRRSAQIPLSPAARTVAMAQFPLLAESLSADRGPGEVKTVRRLSPADLTCVPHNFIPLPGCPSCSRLPEDTAEGAMVEFVPRLKATAEASRLDNPLLTPDRMRETFVDRQTGLIKHVFHDLTSNLMPLAAAEMPIMGSETVEAGYGRTDTIEGSHLVAMLEVVERFAGHEPRAKRASVRGSFAEMSAEYGDRCPHPSIFNLHTADQYEQPTFKLERFSEDLTVDWCWGYSARRREPVLIPSQLVYYWLPQDKHRPVNRFVYDSSNGCAMGGSIEEAALHGLYEIVERDAYLTSWYARLPPRRIDLSTLTDPRALALVARAHADGFEVHLFDMRLDINVPAVWGLIVDPRTNAEVKSYCASAAHGDWDRAVFSALVEITTSIGVYRRTMPLQRDRAYELLEDPWKVVEMHDHVLLYSLSETLPRLDFLFEGEEISLSTCRAQCPPMRERDVTRELEIQIDKVLGVAKDVILVVQDFAAMATVGVSCVKVIVPGLTPVTFGHQYRRFDIARLNHAARARGHVGLRDAAAVNPHPHNFP